MRTAERIIHTAVQLFNEHGTGKVSTNHIASTAQMSPGNLYYHFKNKEEIIRAILVQMYAKWNFVWFLPNESKVTREDLRNRLIMNFEILWEFRFFYREAIALFQADEQLKQKHIQMIDSRMAEQETFVQRFIEAGVLTIHPDKDNLRQLLTACWIVANNWLAFLEMNGSVITAEHFQEGVELIWSILTPYLAIKPAEEESSW
ncbi:TetR/AcrR family transcriptional regulator [Paenibacillus sp. NEAU-GSW1]|uniref:TetR/AcrR family transcriptional regulator n=1 Tax=Paenibacillus sp. NEAU-GSW1 TaxID=2682486 RepID=UPI001562ED8B|nr:TetR/AcrR family transcriptional regulator [Paenibacillus sp. NEAU-GSW1]